MTLIKSVNQKVATGEFIKYPNGTIMSIYSQEAKNGTRFYRYYRGRFQIIGRKEIQEFAYTPKTK